jgi:hypothetical protein
MQTSDFDIFIDKFPCLKNHFLGVYSLDNIPKHMKIKTALIFNDQKVGMPGRHWLGLVHTEKNVYELFDSYGVKINEIKPYLKFKNPKFLYNTGAFQSIETTTCGLFALYYIIHRLLNNFDDFSELLSFIFKINVRDNEATVYSFFNNLD